MRWDCVLSYCLLVIHLGFWLVNIPVWLELCYHLLLWHFWQFMASFCFWVFSCDLWCKTLLLLTGSYKQKRKIPVFKKSSCTCGCSLKFTIFWKPSFFQEEDVCVFGTILISAASPDIWCRKTPFKPNTQNLMSWKCGHVKLGEHWNLAAGSSWQQLVTCSRQYPQRLKWGVDDWGIIASISSFGLWAPCVTQTDVSHKCSHAHRNTATFQH